eukprot:2936820-Alexandrium_andersonii.AAC.1
MLLACSACALPFLRCCTHRPRIACPSAVKAKTNICRDNNAMMHAACAMTCGKRSFLPDMS